MSTPCTDKTCSFYRHYLSRGGSGLTHDGYHAAEVECEKAQRRADNALEAFGSESAAFKAAERLAEEWEARVLA